MKTFDDKRTLSVFRALKGLAGTLAIVACLLAASCEAQQKGPEDGTDPGNGGIVNSGKAITGFVIPGAEPARIKQKRRTVRVTFPLYSVLTGLVPEITVSPGASISPASLSPQDFFSAGGFSPVVYTVTAKDGAKAYWTVTAGLRPLQTMEEVEDYLAGVSGGDDVDNPVPLPVRLDLSDTNGEGWADLLNAIKTAGTGGKFVALDLSECSIGVNVTEFDPRPGEDNSGEDRIVSLVLPEAATSIAASTPDIIAFRQFEELKSVSGENIGTIVGCDFLNFDKLQSVSFPAAANIGRSAFIGCAILANVNLPAATNIGGSAFENCDALATVIFPAATNIGTRAFFECPSLRSLSLPAAETIGHRALGGTEPGGLTVRLGPAPPALETELFSDISVGTKNVTVAVPSGAAAKYGSAPALADTTTESWGNGFRGKGWDSAGKTCLGGSVNTAVNLIIVTY